MSNIFELQQELIDIFDEIEENCGELTPELEERLTITQDEFLDKVQRYTEVIKSLEIDMRGIKEEQARLKALYDKKEKTVNKIKEIIIDAINKFGATKKSGVKYLDYGIGEVSVRKTEAVEVNDNLVDYIGNYLVSSTTYDKICNQLYVKEGLSMHDIIEDVSKNTDMSVNMNELANIDVKLEISMPLKDLSAIAGYPVLREIAQYSDDYKLSTSVSKSAVKPELKENGACMPNLAKLKENKSLIIK